MIFWERLPWHAEFAGLDRYDSNFVPYHEPIQIQYEVYEIVELP